MVRTWLQLCTIGCVWPLLSSGTLRAQAPDAGTEQDASVTPTVSEPALQAPVLLDAPPAVYPSGEPPQLPAADVVLRVTIDTDGRVSDASVVEGVAPAFDEAARAAALQYRFAPGTRAGVPVTSRLLVHVQFTPPPPAAVPELQPTVIAPPEAAPAPTTNSAQEVYVHGKQGEAQRLAQSAEAVTVLTLTTQRREAAPMAEILARMPGVAVRRSGGLGSDERLSLNGLSDEQIATFIDTVPPDFSYLTASIGSFPVNLADRVEIYKGVVPVRFGSDALGGAINIVTDQHYENRLGASAEVGSFGTQRLSLGGTYRHEPSGFVANLIGFYDHAKNDYEIEVEVPNREGRTELAKVRRFHDGYRAYGAAAEVGVVDKPWARRLILQAYLGGSEKEIQHNLIMTVPYGEVHAEQLTRGTTARYEVDLLPQLKLQAIAAYAFREYTFVDRAEFVYDWFGRRGRMQADPGEIGSVPSDQTSYRHSGLGRATLAYTFLPGQVLTLSSTPMYSTQYGESRIPRRATERDALGDVNQRVTFVTGLEHEANFFAMPGAARDATSPDESDYRLQNRLFAKHYNYQLWTVQEVVGRGFKRARSKDSHWFGIGDGVRFRFTRWLMLKASYELAVRLPSAFEVFGDGGQVRPNLELEPESSHNINLSPVVDLLRTPIGDVHYELTGFVRDTDNLIVVLQTDKIYKHENVYAASSVGVETATRWTSPSRYVTLDGSLTFQEFRNRSRAGEGQFGDYYGDRIPNRPWLFASWGARLHFAYQNRHQLEPFYIARMTGWFYRGWESRGDVEFKQRIPSQLSHGVGISYLYRSQLVDYSVTLEAQNLADSKLYDFFGVQRPGRSFWLKITGELH
jgi:vitamin B12 transporter